MPDQEHHGIQAKPAGPAQGRGQGQQAGHVQLLRGARGPFGHRLGSARIDVQPQGMEPLHDLEPNGSASIATDQRQPAGLALLQKGLHAFAALAAGTDVGNALDRGSDESWH